MRFCKCVVFQGLASVFNIALGIVSWWTSKESERYNRLIQLRVFAFCLNILHAYITGPIIYQGRDSLHLDESSSLNIIRLSPNIHGSLREVVLTFATRLFYSEKLIYNGLATYV